MEQTTGTPTNQQRLLDRYTFNLIMDLALLGGTLAAFFIGFPALVRCIELGPCRGGDRHGAWRWGSTR